MNSRFPVSDRVRRAAQCDASMVPELLGTPEGGHTTESAERMIASGMVNVIENGRDESLLHMLRRAFLNPYSAVLAVIALITWVTTLFPQTFSASGYATVAIMSVMVVLSGAVRLAVELKARGNAGRLIISDDVRVSVTRDGIVMHLSPSEITVGDLVHLHAGDMVPADIRITEEKSCMVSQAVLTGESGSFSVTSDPSDDMKNILFRGCVVTAGSADGYAAAVGKDTLFGVIDSSGTEGCTRFIRGANSIAWVLISFMAVLVPVIFVLSASRGGSLAAAFLFSLSAAVGLVPELLPMVMTSCLSRGSRRMGKNETIVKNIDAVGTLGSMDTLCIDKTGTLTEDRLVLEYWMDVLGNESSVPLDLAYMSVMSDGREKDHIERAIRDTERMQKREKWCQSLKERVTILGEMPFDYRRRISSSLVDDKGRMILISKGTPEDIAKRCDSFLYGGRICPMEGDSEQSIRCVTDEMSEDGMKVIAVAFRVVTERIISPDEEHSMTLAGYMTFFDAPRKSALEAIGALDGQNVRVKLLTGDGIREAVSVAGRLGIDTDGAVTGTDLLKMDDDEFMLCAERCSVFAQLTPRMKASIVSRLRENGHVTGFLGDGMNDLPAVLSSDVGISCENASPELRKGADVILRRKDLSVLGESIAEGRKSFMNMQKYVKITLESNLGNIAALVIASLFLPFLPMTSVQFLILNLLYDMMCMVLPWDRCDISQISFPMSWEKGSLRSFMLFFAPISTVFDMITFIFLYFHICPAAAGGEWQVLSSQSREIFVSVFQSGWFMESLWSQILILHLLRTERIPYVESRPSIQVTVVTLLSISVFTYLSYGHMGKLMGMAALPSSYFMFLVPLVLAYMVFVSLMKRIYLKRNRRLL